MRDNIGKNSDFIFNLRDDQNMRFSNSKTIILACEDVQKVVQHYGIHHVMDELIDKMTQSFMAFDPTKTKIPTRSGFNYDHPNTGLVEWMPLHGPNGKVMIKVVGYHPSNPKKYNLPTILSTLSSYDTATGHLLGLVDGVLLTALRTGAASALASTMLAKPDSKVLGLIGCGAQSVTQLHALSRKFDFEKVLVYDVDEEAMFSFKERCGVMDVSAEIIHSTIDKIIASSDILCTATSVDVGKGPLFKSVEVKPGLHVNAVGADFPGKVELPLALLEQSFVCPDFKAQAIIEGECQQLDHAKIGPDLAQVIQHPSQYAGARDSITVFDSTGWALEDQVVMELFLDYAAKLGLGREVEIEFMPEDAKSPYGFMEVIAAEVKK